MKNILLFAPYGLWTVHHQFDAVIGAALKLRGARVVALCCDGVFRKCILSDFKTDHKVCIKCLNKSKSLFERFDIDTCCLSSFLTDADYECVVSWSGTISPKNIASASFMGFLLWPWCAGSVFSKEKASKIDLYDKSVFAYARDILINCALMIRAFLRYATLHNLSNIVCYNAGHVYYRVVFELARQAGIDVLVHERGQVDDSFMITVNRTNYADSTPFDQWSAWGGTPLSIEQLDKTYNMIYAREHGQNTNFLSTVYDGQRGVALAEMLRIPPNRKLLVLYSSGDWEFGISSSAGLTPLFANQNEWIQFVSNFCLQRGVALVVRHHPLGAGSKAYPRAGCFIAEMLNLSLQLPRNVRVVMPAERLNSYDLLWHADVSSVVYSSVAWESVFRGVPSVYTAPYIFSGLGFQTAQTVEEYTSMLEMALGEGGEVNVDRLLRFTRAVHFMCFIVLSHRFKGFGFNGVYGEDIRVREVRELMPGHDPVLDRVCNHILYGADVYEQAQPAPAETERAYIERKYEAIVARRSQARASLLAERSQLPMAVVGVRDGSAEHAVFEASVARTRHAMIARHTVQIGGDTAQALAAIVQLVDSLDVSHVHVCSESVYVGEQAHVEAAHYLERHGCDVVRCGGYWLPDGKDVACEVFTEAAGLSEEQALDACPALHDVWILLAHHVWKRDALLAILRRIHAASLEGQDGVATLFALLATEVRMHVTGTPSIYVYGCGKK